MRLVVFGAVGAVNTAACYALYVLLVQTLALHYDLALAADYGFGTLLGYALHRFTTFGDREHVRQAFGKYVLTLAATFAANLVVLDALVRWRVLGPLVAQAIAMSAVTLGSYAVQKHWVFKSHARSEPAGAAQPNLAAKEVPTRRAA